MNAEFKAFACKAWGVTDEAFVYGNEKIPFSEMTVVKLVTTPTTPLTNGVVQAYYGDKILTCAFPFSQKESAHEAVSFAEEQIEASQGIVKDYKYKITAHTGTTLEVYEDYVIINHMHVGSSLVNIVNGGAVGNKRINYEDMTSIQFREPSGMTVGFIQFAYPGSIESKAGVLDMLDDENSIPIQPSMVEQAREIVDFIEKRRKEIKSEAKGTPTPAFSEADELMKFKQLLDSGAITQEEYDAKKKQILGL